MTPALISSLPDRVHGHDFLGFNRPHLDLVKAAPLLILSTEFPIQEKVFLLCLSQGFEKFLVVTIVIGCVIQIGRQHQAHGAG